LQRLHVPTGKVEVWPTPERIGSFALRDNGGLVCAFASGFAFFDPLNWLKSIGSPSQKPTYLTTASTMGRWTATAASGQAQWMII
jgi:sugar lactone lactonase YvrE